MRHCLKHIRTCAASLADVRDVRQRIGIVRRESREVGLSNAHSGMCEMSARYRLLCEENSDICECQTHIPTYAKRIQRTGHCPAHMATCASYATENSEMCGCLAHIPACAKCLPEILRCAKTFQRYSHCPKHIAAYAGSLPDHADCAKRFPITPRTLRHLRNVRAPVPLSNGERPLWAENPHIPMLSPRF